MPHNRGSLVVKIGLTKIKSLNPDLIMASAFYNEGAVIMDQARKMGIDVPFLGGKGRREGFLVPIAVEHVTSCSALMLKFSELSNCLSRGKIVHFD